jgi:hypothetical protein
MAANYQNHAQAALSPDKNQYFWNKALGGH